MINSRRSSQKVPEDEAFGIALDPAENIYLTGYIESDDFPTENAYQAALSGYADAVVVKLSFDASSLIFSTYLGGDIDRDPVGIE